MAQIGDFGDYSGQDRSDARDRPLQDRVGQRGGVPREASAALVVGPLFEHLHWVRVDVVDAREVVADVLGSCILGAVSGEIELVGSPFWTRFEGEREAGRTCSVGPVGKGAYSAALLRCFAQTRLGHVEDEAHGVEQVGLARGVGADDEKARVQVELDVGEVAPVPQLHVREFHKHLFYSVSFTFRLERSFVS